MGFIIIKKEVFNLNSDISIFLLKYVPTDHVSMYYLYPLFNKYKIYYVFWPLWHENLIKNNENAIKEYVKKYIDMEIMNDLN